MKVIPDWLLVIELRREPGPEGSRPEDEIEDEEEETEEWLGMPLEGSRDEDEDEDEGRRNDPERQGEE